MHDVSGLPTVGSNHDHGRVDHGLDHDYLTVRSEPVLMLSLVQPMMHVDDFSIPGYSDPSDVRFGYSHWNHRLVVAQLVGSNSAKH